MMTQVDWLSVGRAWEDTDIIFVDRDYNLTMMVDQKVDIYFLLVVITIGQQWKNGLFAQRKSLKEHWRGEAIP